MEVKNGLIQDLDIIMELYDAASILMKSKGQVAWPKFSRSMVETDIKSHQLWKIMIDGEIACIWTTAFNDPEIWGEQDKDPSVYIHRITTNQKFKGKGFVARMVAWARAYAQSNQKVFIRLDTVGLNKGLIAHYQRHGFTFLGSKYLDDTESLPAHYAEGEVCFFEIKI